MKRSIVGAACAKVFSAANAAAPILVGLLTPLSSLDAAPLAASYELTVLGFTDVEHTRDDGYRYSDANILNAAGQVAGYAARYNGTGTQLGLSAWLYNGSSTVNIGLTGAEHTSNDGGRYSLAQKLNAAGQVTGYAARYNGTGTDFGLSTWLYNGSSTMNIGPTGTEHTRNDGYRYSQPHSLNDAGQVMGTANRYNGTGTDLGRSVWLYNGSSTVNIGLTGTEHTRNDDYRYSNALPFINAAGQVAGNTYRYNGTGTYLGQSAWLYNGRSTVNIGLTGTEHTRNDGYRTNSTRFLNAAGQVAGVAYRYNGTGASLGQSAWLYNGSSTMNIGPTDTEHTRNDGYRYSDPQRLNAAGQVAGVAYRYNGTATQLGRSVWLYNGSSTVNIGPVDAEHTRNDGYRASDVRFLNAAGQVAGYAERYNGTGTSLGRTAWLYDGSNTVNIGPADTEHTRNDGYRYSDARQLNAAGQVMGTANRYNGTGTSLGQSTWLYDGIHTVDIGPTGSEYTRNDGYRWSYAEFLNDAGQVVGHAERYNGAGLFWGSSAWFYDAAQAQTFELDFSLRSDGYGESRIEYLGDDGLALGRYTLFDANDTVLGARAFAFTLEDGAVDLGGLVEGGLASLDWAFLATAFRANDMGNILGHGLLADMSSGQIGCLLTPVSAVPVPAAAWLFGSGLLGLIGVARRKAV